MPDMNPENARTNAVGHFLSAGTDSINCAQTVLLFATQMLGNRRKSVNLPRYLGGGVGMLGLTCGCLTGAALALALRDEISAEPWTAARAESTRVELREIVQQFVTCYGSTQCRDLTECDFTTPEGEARFSDERIYERCAGYLDFVLGLLAPSLKPVAGKV